MLATERLLSEQIFHDRQATDRAEAFQVGRIDLKFRDEDYLDHESWIRPAFRALGDLRGKRVLDYGCGHGMAAVVFARNGATVNGFDLSEGYVNEARLRAKANGVHVQFEVANAEELPFEDNSFDAIWGCAILHHLDLCRAAQEINRVLVPGGIAVFCEPWGGNPVLEFARRCLPYPQKERTPDERPLRKADLPALRNQFPGLTVQGFQLFSMIRRVWKANWLISGLDKVDARLLRAVPALNHWCRYVVLKMTKEPN